MKIFDLVDARAIATYWENAYPDATMDFLGQKFFPNAALPDNELRWIKGYNQAPVALQPSALDTKASMRDRIGFEEIRTGVPFFREGARMGEQEFHDLQMFSQRGGAAADAVIARIYEDRAALIKGALVQGERMRWSLLTTGGIDIQATDENGRDVHFEYNFDPDNEWATNNNIVIAGAQAWTKANEDTSDPIDDLSEAVISMRNRGVNVTDVYMNSTTLRGLLASKSIRIAMNPVGDVGRKYFEADLRSAVEHYANVTIHTYDNMFVNEQGAQTKYLPDGKVVLLPGGSPLGNTYYGMTPEAARDGLEKYATHQRIAPGISLTSYLEPHPVNSVLIVSETVMPSFEAMDSVYVMQVS